MYNQEILDRLKGQFGTEETIKFCEMTSAMYFIKHLSCKNDECRNEYGYEKDWWEKAEKDLKELHHGKAVPDV